MSNLTQAAPAVKPTVATDPRSSWPAWTDEFVWTATPDDDGPAPSWEAESFEPSDEDLAEEAGFSMGLEGEPAPDVTDLSVPTPIYLAATRGWVAGRGQRAYDGEMDRLRTIDEEYEAHLDARALERLEDSWMAPRFEGDGFSPGYTS